MQPYPLPHILHHFVLRHEEKFEIDKKGDSTITTSKYLVSYIFLY